MTGARALLFAVAMAVCFWKPAHAQVYTSYSFSPTEFSWSTCGELQGDSGCFDAGVVQGFGNLCAAMEDNERPNDAEESNRQRIYLMDNNATGNNDVVLHVLEKKIVINGASAQTTFTRVADVALSLIGGAPCQAAANKVLIVAGTASPTPQTALIDKKTLTVIPHSFPAPGRTNGRRPTTQGELSILSDAPGYISINSNGSFYIISPTGQGVEDGGGDAYVIPKSNAFIIP